MINKITSFVDYNKWLKRLDTPNEPANQKLVKAPMLLNNLIRKRYYRLWGLV